LEVEEPNRVVWSSLWPRRPNDQVHFELTAVGGETSLRFALLTPDEAPGQSKTGHLRRRLNHLLFANLPARTLVGGKLSAGPHTGHLRSQRSPSRP
jgi:hypothetical protein